MEQQTYASKSTATRGAKRLGIDAPEVEQIPGGRWIIKRAPLMNGSYDATGDQQLEEIDEPTKLDPIPTGNQVEENAPEDIVPMRVGIPESYNDLEAISPIKSQVVRPVEFIWAVLELNPAMLRKEAIAYLVKLGININTARTQYQRFRAANGVRKK